MRDEIIALVISVGDLIVVHERVGVTLSMLQLIGNIKHNNELEQRLGSNKSMT